MIGSGRAVRMFGLHGFSRRADNRRFMAGLSAYPFDGDGQKHALEKVTDFTNSAFRAIYAGIDNPPGFSANSKFRTGGYGSGMDHGETWKTGTRNGRLSAPVRPAGRLAPSRIMWGGRA